MTRPATPARGFALLIVLWSVVLLALLATGITAAGRSDVQLAGNIRRAASAQAAADGGIAAALFHLGDTPGRAWQADGSDHRLTIGGYALTVRIADESRKVNPTAAPPRLMAALLTGCGSDPSRAAALADAINAWHTPGAQDVAVARYRAAGLGAAPTGAALRSVGELGLVIGMTPDLLACLQPHLSVFAADQVNLAQADPAVQAALRSLGQADPSTVRPSVVEITADARAGDGGRFIRHAIVSLGRDQAGRAFRVLLWDARSGP